MKQCRCGNKYFGDLSYCSACKQTRYGNGFPAGRSDDEQYRPRMSIMVLSRKRVWKVPTLKTQQEDVKNAS